MPRLERSALVMYSAQQMYDLVNDIEAYPQFMEGCVAAKVLRREADWLEARLVLSKGGLSQSFVTRNRLCPPESITMSLVEGPLSRLEGQWSFTALHDQACKVSFSLDIELQNRLLGLAAGKIFESLASKQVDAICARARQVYG